MTYKRPVPGNDPDFGGGTNHTKERHKAAHGIDGTSGKRQKAGAIARNRPVQYTSNNNELTRYPDSWPTNFHKGIPHNEFGIPDSKAYHDFLHALSRDGVADGEYSPFGVALGPKEADEAYDGNRTGGGSYPTLFHSVVYDGSKKTSRVPGVRNWESPLGGHAYDTEGPDAGDVAMAPAPTLPNTELCAEMADVYAMALLRDVPFHEFKTPDYAVQQFTLNSAGDGLVAKAAGFSVGQIVDSLRKIKWFVRDEANASGINWSYGLSPTDLETRRHTARFDEPQKSSNESDGTAVDGHTLFRGSVPGAKVGPYISQFLLIGHPLRGGGSSTDKENSRGKMRSEGPATGSLISAKEQRSATMRVESYSAEPGKQDERKRAISEGRIIYGAQLIDQRVDGHQPGLDHLTDWPLWLDAQNGANVGGSDRFYPDGNPRFVTRPRDLATYVHFDQLYQAYLNACLLLFNFGVPFDFGFPSGKGHPTRGSFATFGGPHILSLMTEVATRGLKAVRRQKFQHHVRGRPEQLAAMLTLAANDHEKLGTENHNAEKQMKKLLDKMTDSGEGPGFIMSCIAAHNAHQNKLRMDSLPADGIPDENTIFPRRVTQELLDAGLEKAALWKDQSWDEANNYLLPMAFPEGSPMHAAYGAGHATVAGACVTILKAFFEMSQGSVKAKDNKDAKPPLSLEDAQKVKSQWWEPASMGKADPNEPSSAGLGLPCLFRGPDDLVAKEPKERLQEWHHDKPADLTIEGELNKLAANISIGRNMAGVHFYTDYYDSLRMGERIAVGVLQEQMATYPEATSMRLTSFDNDRLIIHGDGLGTGHVEIWDGSDWTDATDANSWWNRHIADFQPGGSPGPI